MSRANFCQVKLATPIDASATQLSIKVDLPAYSLPPVDGGLLTLMDAPGRPGKIEIIKYTSRSGTGPYTISGITRAQEGTKAQAWATDSYVLMSLTAGEVASIEAEIDELNRTKANLSGARFTAEVSGPGTNQWRMYTDAYGSFWRLDGVTLYLLLTNKDDPWGTWNTLRPFSVNLSSGRARLGCGVDVDGGLRSSGNITLTSNADDAPNLIWANPSYSVYKDIVGGVFRAYSESASSVGTFSNIYTFDIAGKTASFFDKEVWTKGNFNPGGAAYKNLSTSSDVYDTVAHIQAGGVMEVGKYIDFHGADNDGKDYLTRLEAGADGYLYQTHPTAGLGRVLTSRELDYTRVARGGASANTAGMYLKATDFPSIAAADDTNYDTCALTIENNSNQASAAVIQFHRGGQYAAYFGLDTDSQWKVGGRSMGKVAYPVWHDGMDTTTRVRNSIASLPTGEIGTYALLRNLDNARSFSAGELAAGSTLAYSSAFGDVNGRPTGTWRCCGFVLGQQGNSTAVSLFKRVS